MAKPLHTFHMDELSTYLETHVAGFAGLTDISKFPDGQSNPTYKLRDAAGQRFVLRAKPPGVLLKSAHAVDREYRVMSALAQTPVPVPQMAHLSGDDTPLGTQFFVMEMVEGAVYWDPAFPDHSNEFRAGAYASQIATLAALHDVDPVAVGLADFGKPGNYFERQVSRWTKQYRASELDPNPDMDWVIDWLVANQVADDGQVSIVHGDYRLDNLMFKTDHPYFFDQPVTDIAAVLDWELSTLGHPFADLAYHCMGLRLPQTALIKGLGDIKRTPLGIPNEEDYIAQYCQLRGIAGYCAIQNTL